MKNRLIAQSLPASDQSGKSFRAVIFDLDGTLFDSLIDLGEAMNEVLANHSYPAHPVSAYRYFVGDGMAKLVSRALPEEVRSNNEILAMCLEQMRTAYSKRWDRCSTLYPGIPEMLDGLNRRKLALCILSNKPQHLTKAIKDKFLAKWAFHQVVGAIDGIPLKPDPTSALNIAKTLEIPPNNIIFMGDTSVDMKTAARAGMCGIGCLWGFREKAELQKTGALELLNYPEELLNHPGLNK